MEQTKRAKFNVVDILILVIILAVAGVFVWRYAVSGREADGDKARGGDAAPFTMTLDNMEITDDTFQDGKLKVGDILIEKATGAEIGVITGIEVKPARSVTVDAGGNYVAASRPYCSYIIVTVKGKGFRPEEGGLRIGDWHAYVNKSYEINIGDCAFWLRVFDFKLEGDDV